MKKPLEPQLSAEMEKRWIKKIQQQRFNNIKSFLLESSATEKDEFINELADMMVMELDIAQEEERERILNILAQKAIGRKTEDRLLIVELMEYINGKDTNE